MSKPAISQAISHPGGIRNFLYLKCHINRMIHIVAVKMFSINIVIQKVTSFILS